jgi:multiple sugar transport system permease protein
MMCRLPAGRAAVRLRQATDALFKEVPVNRVLRLGAARKNLLPYALLFPAVVGLVLFSLYPFLSGIWYSFTGIGWIGDEAPFVGLKNYEHILTGDIGSDKFFKQALVQGVYWTAAVVVGQFIVGLFTALVLNERFPGRFLFRMALLVPIAVPTVILALTWQWMYDPFYGLINHYLRLLGLLSGPKAWVGQPNSPMWPLILVGIWRGFPFMAVMLLSGLQGIQHELYEAAEVDGANVIDRFRYITLPQLRTIIMIALMLHTLWWWNHFDIIKIVGLSAQEFAYRIATLPILAWFEAFQWSHLARGAAISVMSMVMLTGIMIWNARREARSVQR